MALLTRPAVVAIAIAATMTALPAASHAAAPLPPGFLWGVASSGFQSEGSPDGIPASNWTVPRAGQTPIGTSVDFRNRYRSDIALAAGLGVKVYRIGVEWARVQPAPTRFDQHEWAYYDDMIGAIVAAGMRPMITIDHWVYPQWMMRAGGWTNPASVRLWLAYAQRVVHRFAKFRPMWVTFNEPIMNIAQQLMRGELSPAAAPVVADRMVQVHQQIYRVIHRAQPGAMVTSNSAYMPAGAEPVIDVALTDRFMRHADFVGVDTYYGFTLSNPLAAAGAVRDGLAGLPVSAESIYYALRHNARRYPGRPIYIVESGMPTAGGGPRADGYRRGDQLADLIYWVQRARADGIPVIGYNYWSLTDNYEWGSYTPRFGLYTVNVLADRTLRRIPTDAVAVYRRITARNGVGSNYRPTRAPAACSIVEAAASCLDPVR
jgi:beta-glucosidase|nr:family 1 glycosylhydrolase [Gordonia sp. UBA5067]